MESVIRNQVQRRRRVILRAQDQQSRKGSERPQVQHRRGGSETAQVQCIGKQGVRELRSSTEEEGGKVQIQFRSACTPKIIHHNKLLLQYLDSLRCQSIKLVLLHSM